MSVIDRAFIRAYGLDGDAASTSSGAHGPHLHQCAEATQPPMAPTHFGVYTTSSIDEPATESAVAPQSERRPLSTYSAADQHVDAHFQPALEVDAFQWSEVGDDLVAKHGGRCGAVVQTLMTAAESGRSLIGVGGARHGLGTTTLVAVLGRLLAQTGLNVALVDGDFSSAALARSLGLGVELGWEDVLAGRIPLSEAVIYSLADRLALLPLAQGGARAAEKLDGIHASITAGILRYHFDLALFDLGTLDDANQAPTIEQLARRCRLDGFLLAASAEPEQVSPDETLSLRTDLAAICLGAIENFAAVA